MRLALPRLALRRILTLIAAVILAVVVVSFILPSDDVFRSLLRFHWSRLSSFISPADQTWVFKPAQYQVNFNEDVGLLIKTGYGTQSRVIPQMKAMGLTGTKEDVIVVGDFHAVLEEDGIRVDVANVIERMLRDGDEAMDYNGGTPTVMTDKPGIVKYMNLKHAIWDGDDGRAKVVGERDGWHLDALKFIPGLERAYGQAPTKKWWIVLDDDTFLLKTSLEKILSRLDPTKGHYIGNAVGDYKGRFAHGGSAIALSQGTMRILFSNPRVVHDAKISSLSETWGDKLLATTLMKVGIYLDERFTPFFNGEPPRMTKMTAETFCLPIVSFHGLGNPDKMTTAGNIFTDTCKMVFWGSIWSVYKEPDLVNFEQNPVRPGHDHAGRLDQSTTTFEGVQSAYECVSKCDVESKTCLAWTWVEASKKCHLAPWVVVGNEVEGKFSGVHYPRAKEIGDKCEEMMKEAGCFENGADCGI